MTNRFNTGMYASVVGIVCNFKPFRGRRDERKDQVMRKIYWGVHGSHCENTNLKAVFVAIASWILGIFIKL